MTDSAASVSGQGIPPQRKQTPEIEGQKGAMGLSRQVTLKSSEENLEPGLIEAIPTTGVPQAEPQNVEVQKAESGRATPSAEEEEEVVEVPQKKIQNLPKAIKRLGENALPSNVRDKALQLLGLKPKERVPIQNDVGEPLRTILAKDIQDNMEQMQKTIAGQKDPKAQMREARKFMEQRFEKIFDTTSDNYDVLLKKVRANVGLKKVKEGVADEAQIGIDEEARLKYLLRDEYMKSLEGALKGTLGHKKIEGGFLREVASMRKNLPAEEEFRKEFLQEVHLCHLNKASIRKHIGILVDKGSYFKGNVEDLQTFLQWNKEDINGATGEKGYKLWTDALNDALKSKDHK